MLVGTSSVGKTSIVRELLKTQPERVEVDPDIDGLYIMFDFMEAQQVVPQEAYNFLKSVLKPRPHHMELHNAVTEGIFEFKEGVPLADQTRAQQIAETLREPTLKFAAESGGHTEEFIVNKAFGLFAKGLTSVAHMLNDGLMQKHPQAPQATIKTFLVYCPFTTLVERIKTRNQLAFVKTPPDYHEFRPCVSVLWQIPNLMRPKQAADEVVLDKIYRQDIEKIFAEMNADQSNKEAFLKAIGFTDSTIEYVELTPRSNNYTQIINSANFGTDPTAAATKMAQLILAA